MKYLILLIMILTMTTLADIKIGYEVSILSHIENDFDFNPDVQHKILVGNDYLSVFVGCIPNKQTLSNKKAVEIIDTQMNYEGYSITQTYFSDHLNFGFQSNPTGWLGVYVGLIQGGKIELSDKYESLYNITKEDGVQFGFVLTPKVTENTYIGLGTGWDSITNCSHISIQLAYNIQMEE